MMNMRVNYLSDNNESEICDENESELSDTNKSEIYDLIVDIRTLKHIIEKLNH